MTDLLSLAATTLRHPDALVSSRREDLSTRAPGLLALAALGLALFGVVVASQRGGLQLVYGAVKAPFLLLLPLAVCLPALRTLYDPDGDRLDAVRVTLAGLVGAARGGLLAAAATPLLWLLYSLQPDYHLAVLAMAGTLAVSALPGLWTTARVLSGGRLALGATLTSVVLLGFVTAQTGWLLRPFVVRPNAEIAFLRTVEADVVSSLGATAASASGHYDGWEARPSGYLGRQLATPDSAPVEVWTPPTDVVVEPTVRDAEVSR